MNSIEFSFWLDIIKVDRLTLMFALFYIFIPSNTFCITYLINLLLKICNNMNNFLHFQLNFNPKNYFQNMRNSDDFHLSKTLHMLRKPVDKHKYVYCMCDYLILISCGWLRKFSMHYRGKYLKKDFKISGWLMISIHVREKSEMERGRVGVWGGPKQWTYTPRHISWDIFPEQCLLCSFPPPPPFPNCEIILCPCHLADQHWEGQGRLY